MFFYIILAPSLMLLFILFARLLKMRKHDVVLFKFCQIRRSAMGLLRDKHDSLTEEDYRSLREILNALEVTIHYYDDCKTHIFNYRFFIKKLRELRVETRGVERSGKATNNPEVLAIAKEFKVNMVKAFLAYTPFLRSEILIRAFLFLNTMLAKTGINIFKKIVDYLKWLVEEMQEPHNGDNHTAQHA